LNARADGMALSMIIAAITLLIVVAYMWAGNRAVRR
jgi:hypothetical protein